MYSVDCIAWRNSYMYLFWNRLNFRGKLIKPFLYFKSIYSRCRNIHINMYRK